MSVRQYGKCSHIIGGGRTRNNYKTVFSMVPLTHAVTYLSQDQDVKLDSKPLPINGLCNNNLNSMGYTCSHFGILILWTTYNCVTSYKIHVVIKSGWSLAVGIYLLQSRFSLSKMGEI